MLSRATALSVLLAPFASGAVEGQRADTTVIRVGPQTFPGVATLVEEWTLGNGSTADVYKFSRARIFSGPDGSVYIVDVRGLYHSDESAVREYDRTGNFVREIGRNGTGPGEYRFGVGDVKALSDGRILLSDRSGVLVYSRTGIPITRWAAPAKYGNEGSSIFVTPSGSVLTYGRKVGGGSFSIPILFRFRSDGTLVDTVVPPEASFAGHVQPQQFRRPFEPTDLAAWSPLGYFITSNTATYAVDLRIPKGGADGGMWRAGDPVVSIRRTVAPVPVGDAERRDWKQSITMNMRSEATTRNWQWTGPEIVTTKRPVRDLYIAAEGRIWVRLSQPARLEPSVTIPDRPAGRNESYRLDAVFRWVEPFLYDVYEPTGKFVGQVRLPDRTSSFAVQGDTVWVAANDQDDVPVVKRYRIAWRG